MILYSAQKQNELEIALIHTRIEDISDARVRISAQETTPGQACSTAVLMSFTTSKPLRELLFGRACCSLSMVAVLFNKTDASHP